jgi:hypothetical protein
MAENPFRPVRNSADPLASLLCFRRREVGSAKRAVGRNPRASERSAVIRSMRAAFFFSGDRNLGENLEAENHLRRTGAHLAHGKGALRRRVPRQEETRRDTEVILKLARKMRYLLVAVIESRLFDRFPLDQCLVGFAQPQLPHP